MYYQIFTIVAPVFFLAGVGYFWATRASDYPAEFITRLIMNISAPCLFISAMDRAEVAMGDLGNVVLAAATVFAATALLAYPVIRACRLNMRVYLPPLLFPNCGNMGLSLCMFGFGDTGLALGLGIFMAMTVCQFTLGILIVDQSGKGMAGRLLDLAKQPIVHAAIFALACKALDYQLPEWAGNSLTLMGGVTIPLMLMTLGVSLAQLSISNLPRALTVSVARLLGGFLLGLAAVTFYDLQGVERGVVLVQASMPVAVFNYLLAIRYHQSPRDTAGMVVLSTLIAFLCLPLLLGYVMV